MSVRTAAPVVPAAIVVLTTRDRARRLVRPAFPRRRGPVVVARGVEEFSAALRAGLVDAALVDLAAGESAWSVAALAREFPSVPFLLLAPLWPADAPLFARAAALECADVLGDGVDDGVIAALVEPHRFTTRFAAALREPPPAFALTTPLQREVWRSVVGRTGRPTTTSVLAEHFRLSREHLSRSFAVAGAPTLKRVIDVVRVCAAAELAKNPGYDVADVASILGFASSSHLAATTQRLVGTRPSSLARLRTVDILERVGARR
ncbi:MAG: helix-turn-helix domain-containing protein [Gemmatimonadaceae bacterium]